MGNKFDQHGGHFNHNTISSSTTMDDPTMSSYHPRRDNLPINASSSSSSTGNSPNATATSTAANTTSTAAVSPRQHPLELGLQDPSHIAPYLLLGGSLVNKNPELVSYLGITHVVNMAVELPPNFELVANRGLVYKHIRSDDSLRYNIRIHFEEAFEVIDDARTNNGRVLVHCMMGISRSG
jgi:hypothetical protein